jgi:hypothetical protein
MDLNNDQTLKYSKVILSEQFLKLLGITKDMYVDFVSKEKMIPDPFSKVNYLNSWN